MAQRRSRGLPDPAGFAELRARMVERYPELSPQQKGIAEFALAHPETMAMETAAQLAQRLGVQPSSLVRFAQALDYPGFNEMKRRFRAQLIFKMAEARDREAGQGQGREQGPAAALGALLGEGVAELQRMSKELDRQRFEQAVARLAAADEIYVTAQHLAFPFACLFSWTLLRFGRQCQLLDNIGGFALRQSELAGPRDATLAISFAPYQPSVVQAAKAHADRGGSVVGLTDTPLSPLAPFAEILLEIPHREPTAAHALAGVTCLVQALAVAVCRYEEC